MHTIEMRLAPGSNQIISLYLLSKWSEQKFGERIEIEPKWINKFAEGLRDELILKIKLEDKTSNVDIKSLILEFSGKDSIEFEDAFHAFRREHRKIDITRNDELRRIRKADPLEILNEYTESINAHIDKKTESLYNELFINTHQLSEWGFFGMPVNPERPFLIDRMYELLRGFESAINVDREEGISDQFKKRPEKLSWQKQASVDRNINEVSKFLKKFDYSTMFENDFSTMMGAIIVQLAEYKKRHGELKKSLISPKARGRPESKMQHFYMIAWIYKYLGELQEKYNFKFSVIHTDDEGKPQKISVARNEWVWQFQNLLSEIIKFEYKIRKETFEFKPMQLESIEQTASRLDSNFDYMQYLEEKHPLLKHSKIFQS
jgi:hypothetical protein